MTTDVGHDERFAALERQVSEHAQHFSSLQPGLPTSGPHRKLALPIPLGSFSIGATTWLLGLLILNARGTTMPNGWYINGLPMGSILVLLCGIGEFFTGNTFGCALFTSVGSIIFGLVLPFLPWTGVISSSIQSTGNMATGLQKVNVSSGIYLLVIWATLFVLLLSAQRTAIAVVTSLVWINIVLITFGIANMTGNIHCLKAAGSFLIIVSANLFYNGTAVLLLEVGHPFAKFFPLGGLGHQG